MKPLEIWKSQGTGIGLPMIIPLREDPRGDKALLDQLVSTGTRTIKGVAAVNGLALRKMRVGSDIKTQISGFEAAAKELEDVMKAVRELDIDPYNEMKKGKLKDTFSVFKKRVGPKEEEESETTLEEEESEEEETKVKDEDVDFGVSDEDIEFEEEEEEDAQPEEPPEPEWPDIMNGPLTAEGRFDVEPYTGEPRFLMPRSGLFASLRRKSYRKVWEFVQHINISVVTLQWSQEWLLHPLVGFRRLLSPTPWRP